MAKKVVSFSLALGRSDRIDPRLAPFGVVAVAKNLRVRKDGRLACRNGYVQVSSPSSIGAVYDLHEYQGRLVALAESGASGYPTDIFEYDPDGVGESWHSKRFGADVAVFVDMKEMALASPPTTSVDEADAACGLGFVCMVTRSVAGQVLVIIARESDGQTIAAEALSVSKSTAHFRVTFAVDTFYIASQRSDNSIDVLQFTPGTHTAWQTLVNQASAASATPAVLDIVPVQTPTTGRIVLAWDRGAAASLIIRVYNSAGAQVGADITLAGTDTISLSVCADQTASRIHLGIIVTGGAGSLRTYNFAGAVLLGPTATTAGTHLSICRLPATAGAAAQVAVAVTAPHPTSNTVVQIFSSAAHLGGAGITLSGVVMTTRLLPWAPASSTSSTAFPVVFGGYISPLINSTTGGVSLTARATNALFFHDQFSFQMATRDFTHSLPGTYRNLGLHLDSSTGRVVWCALKDSGSGLPQAAITTCAKHSTARRGSAQFGDLLYFAGAPVQVYDGRMLTEAFQEVPGIYSATPSVGAGALSFSASYQYAVHWEVTLADGSLWSSPVSEPYLMTTSAAQNTATVVASLPHHWALCLNANFVNAPGITVVLSRTVWDGSGVMPGYRRAATVAATATLYGGAVTFADVISDADLADEGVVYTQGARGNVSGPLEHNAAQACRYIAATESRLLTGGLLRRSMVEISKDAFLQEPITFSEFETFFAQVSGAVRGVASLDGARLVFTANEIFAFFGDGPDDTGGGAIGRAQDIPSPSGLEDWRSLLKASDGLYFQLDDSKLYRMPRGGGSPEWLGVDVQDTLTTYPVITGSAKCRRDDTVVFSCENTASSDGRLVVRSLRTGIWTEDTPPLTASQGIEGLCSYGDTLAYITGGLVYVQSTTSFADGTSSVIPTQIKTHPIYPFDLGGYGTIWAVLLTGEYRSAGTLALRISYDDGINFTTYDSFTLSGLTAGQTVARKWAVVQSDVTSLVFEWTFTPSSAGEGFIAINAAVLVEPEDGLRELILEEAA